MDSVITCIVIGILLMAVIKSGLPSALVDPGGYADGRSCIATLAIIVAVLFWIGMFMKSCS